MLRVWGFCLGLGFEGERDFRAFWSLGSRFWDLGFVAQGSLAALFVSAQCMLGFTFPSP